MSISLQMLTNQMLLHYGHLINTNVMFRLKHKRMFVFTEMSNVNISLLSRLHVSVLFYLFIYLNWPHVYSTLWLFGVV